MLRRRVIEGLCLFLSSVLVQAQSGVQRLQDVKKLYVGSLGDSEGSDLIRSKIISHLVKSGRIEVVENENQADAILTGASKVAQRAYYNANATTTNANANAGTRYDATAGVRLLNKDSRILWADDTSNGMFARSVTSSIADKISKDLLKAIAADAKKK